MLKNSLVAANLCTQRYPEHGHPTEKSFKRREMKLRNGWSISNRRRILTATHVENEIRVLGTILENTHTGQQAREIGISQ